MIKGIFELWGDIECTGRREGGKEEEIKGNEREPSLLSTLDVEKERSFKSFEELDERVKGKKKKSKKQKEKIDFQKFPSKQDLLHRVSHKPYNLNLKGTICQMLEWIK